MIRTLAMLDKKVDVCALSAKERMLVYCEFANGALRRSIEEGVAIEARLTSPPWKKNAYAFLGPTLGTTLQVYIVSIARSWWLKFWRTKRSGVLLETLLFVSGQ